MASQAEVLHLEGVQLYRRRMYEEAIRRFSEAHEHFAEDGRQRSAGEVLNNITAIRMKQKRWDDAFDVLDEAMRTFKRVGDREREAYLLEKKAEIYAARNAQEDAETSWAEAASMYRELKDRDAQGWVLMRLGRSMYRSGRRREGLATFKAGSALLSSQPVGVRFRQTLLQLRIGLGL